MNDSAPARSPCTLPRLPRSLALATLSFLAAGVAPAQGFVDITTRAGLQNVPVDATSFWGRGLCCGDFDRDGDEDLIVPGAPGRPNRYFENDGTATFTERTATAGLGIAGTVRCCSAADVDSDGDLDVYLGRDERDQLFINNGRAGFTEQAARRGADTEGPTYTASFGDYDRDGHLDIYLAIHHIFIRNALLRNNGDGTFTTMTRADRAGSLGYTFAAVFADYDGDLWPDVFVSQDKGGAHGPNELWKNRGDGTFTDVSVAMDVSTEIEAMGIDFTDVFNDGGIDFYMTDGPTDHLFEVWDPALGRFLEAQHLYGVVGGPVGWACNFLDYDNDGWQDLYVVHREDVNHLYRNPARPAGTFTRWTEVAASLGTAVPGDKFTVLVADFDNDGREDLLHAIAAPAAPTGGLLLQRNTVAAGNWLKIRTIGTISNRDGFGAQIAVTVGSTTTTEHVRSGVGYLSGSDLRCNFGLGTATQADRVTIRWPSGQVQYFTGESANRILVAEEPRYHHVGTARPGSTTTLQLSSPGDAGLVYAVPLSLTAGPPIRLPSGREIPMFLDALSVYTLEPGNLIVPQGLGTLGAGGAVSCPMYLPNIPALSGVTLYSTAVTFDPTFPEGIRSILPAIQIAIR